MRIACMLLLRITRIVCMAITIRICTTRMRVKYRWISRMGSRALQVLVGIRTSRIIIELVHVHYNRSVIIHRNNRPVISTIINHHNNNNNNHNNILVACIIEPLYIYFIRTLIFFSILLILTNQNRFCDNSIRHSSIFKVIMWFIGNIKFILSIIWQTQMKEISWQQILIDFAYPE